MISAFIILSIFAATVIGLSYPTESHAADLSHFDPGYIISDYTMSDYASMSVDEIQDFLSSHGNCGDTGTHRTSEGGNTPEWFHVKDGHFVCLSEEVFGEGTDYGDNVKNGKSAAQIIYDVAHEHRINPKVLIVLLEKEQGLISDSWPNIFQYRIATGYGCPDTGEGCDKQYYGFKNQLSWAAHLFRTVLDGGWTNFPLGDNYIGYNPDPGCGGSIVNVRNLATSSLYRYTPYQPNAEALAAGYGSGVPCGAYGNRNFYLLFNDWFGDSTIETGYIPFETPRYMMVTKDTERISLTTGKPYDKINAGTILFFSSKIKKEDYWCYRTEYGTENNEDVCIPSTSVSDIRLDIEDVSEDEQYMIAKTNTYKINIAQRKNEVSVKEGEVRKMPKKATLLDKTYYFTEYNVNLGDYSSGIPAEGLSKLTYETLETPLIKCLAKQTDRINPFTKEHYDTLSGGKKLEYSSMIKIGSDVFYRTKHNTENDINAAIDQKNLIDCGSYIPFENPRMMKIKNTTDRFNPYSGDYYDTLDAGRVIKFTTKIQINDEWYYRTEHNTINNIDAVVPARDVEEV